MWSLGGVRGLGGGGSAGPACSGVASGSSSRVVPLRNGGAWPGRHCRKQDRTPMCFHGSAAATSCLCATASRAAGRHTAAPEAATQRSCSSSPLRVRPGGVRQGTASQCQGAHSEARGAGAAARPWWSRLPVPLKPRLRGRQATHGTHSGAHARRRHLRARMNNVRGLLWGPSACAAGAGLVCCPKRASQLYQLTLRGANAHLQRPGAAWDRHFVAGATQPAQHAAAQKPWPAGAGTKAALSCAHMPARQDEVSGSEVCRSQQGSAEQPGFRPTVRRGLACSVKATRRPARHHQPLGAMGPQGWPPTASHPHSRRDPCQAAARAPGLCQLLPPLHIPVTCPPFQPGPRPPPPSPRAAQSPARRPPAGLGLRPLYSCLPLRRHGPAQALRGPVWRLSRSLKAPTCPSAPARPQTLPPPLAAPQRPAQPLRALPLRPQHVALSLWQRPPHRRPPWRAPAGAGPAAPPSPSGPGQSRCWARRRRLLLRRARQQPLRRAMLPASAASPLPDPCACPAPPRRCPWRLRHPPPAQVSRGRASHSSTLFSRT